MKLNLINSSYIYIYISTIKLNHYSYQYALKSNEIDINFWHKQTSTQRNKMDL